MGSRTARNENRQRRQKWQAVIAHAMVLLAFLSLVLPRACFAAPIPGLASASITSGADRTDGIPPVPEDAGLVQHAHCTCHLAVRPSWTAASVPLVPFSVVHTARAEAPPRLGPSSIPFKPPRA